MAKVYITKVVIYQVTHVEVKNVFPFADILKKTIFEYATSRTTYCYRE